MQHELLEDEDDEDGQLRSVSDKALDMIFFCAECWWSWEGDDVNVDKYFGSCGSHG